MNRVAILAASALLVGSAAPAVAGDTITFGQFFQQNSASRQFRYVNQDTSTSKGAHIYTTASSTTTAAGSIPIYFLLSLANLPADLVDPQFAGLSVDFTSTSGTTGSGSSRVQMFGNGTVSILRDTPANEGLNARTNLLTVTFQNAELDASQNSGSFTFKSNDNTTITYTSDFLDFSNVVAEDFSFSFSGASPRFSANLGSSSVNSRFSGTGTFASNPVPTTFGVPEASTWAMLCIGFGAVGAVMRTGRRKKDLFAA
jgi:hypothetical protein